MIEQSVDITRPGNEGLRVAIFHGAHGSPDTNWFPWLRRELQAEGLEVIRPRLPTPRGQSLDAWFEAFDCTVRDLMPSSTLLVGHSLGAAFALRLIERSAEPFSATFLAAGFVGALGLPDYDPINASFFATPFDWPAIRDRAGQIFCWAGADDPYVPVSRTRQVADLLDAPLHIVNGGGHLNTHGRLTASVKKFLKRIIGRVRALADIFNELPAVPCGFGRTSLDRRLENRVCVFVPACE